MTAVKKCDTLEGCPVFDRSVIFDIRLRHCWFTNRLDYPINKVNIPNLLVKRTALPVSKKVLQ